MIALLFKKKDDEQQKKTEEQKEQQNKIAVGMGMVPAILLLFGLIGAVLFAFLAYKDGGVSNVALIADIFGIIISLLMTLTGFYLRT
jgi:uncharacterized protein YacL